MVDDFVAAVGKGVIRLDASHAEPMRLREAKRQRTLACQRQERGLPEPVPPSQWIAKINRTTSFDGCPVPLDVVLCTPDKNPKSDDAWAIMTTADAAFTGMVKTFAFVTTPAGESETQASPAK